MKLSSYIRGGYRRYISWVGPYALYLTHRIGLASGRPIVVITSYQHPYVRNLRQSVGGKILFMPYRQPRLFALPVPFRRVAIFHLHFINELGLDLAQTRRLIARLRSSNTKIIWTAHDLISHDKDYERFEPLFAAWAGAADGVAARWRAERSRR